MTMKDGFIREKVIHCGRDFLSPCIYPYTGRQIKASGRGRAPKKYISAPKQKNLNDRRAKRYFVQLANSNFGAGDLAVHLTYAPEHLPSSEEEAQKIVGNYLRRIAYRRQKKGLEPLKYLCTTEIGSKSGRIHHHLIINGGLSRDEVESLWWFQKGNRDGKGTVMYGIANADRLQPDEAGLESIARYIVKDPAGRGDKGEQRGSGRRHWTQSQNLTKPWYRTPNDDRYSKRIIEKIAGMPEDSEEFRGFWERKYRGYKLLSCEKNYAEESGWYFYLTMRRITGRGDGER